MSSRPSSSSPSSSSSCTRSWTTTPSSPAGPSARGRWIIWAGLGFDLFFTIEFLTRMYLALMAGKGTQYFFRERGWIDFLASIPLLLLNSLPHALALLAGAGLLSGLGSFLNVLKVIKAVRIARILRLLRVVKLFRTIRYARSPMAQAHVSTITTIAVSILVLWTLAASVLEGVGVIPGIEGPFTTGQVRRAARDCRGGADPVGARRTCRGHRGAGLDDPGGPAAGRRNGLVTLPGLLLRRALPAGRLRVPPGQRRRGILRRAAALDDRGPGGARLLRRRGPDRARVPLRLRASFRPADLGPDPRDAARHVGGRLQPRGARSRPSGRTTTCSSWPRCTTACIFPSRTGWAAKARSSSSALKIDDLKDLADKE